MHTVICSNRRSDPSRAPHRGLKTRMHAVVASGLVGVASLFGPASTHAASLTGLGDLPGDGFLSTASGVSGDGSTVVGVGLSASGLQAIRHTAGGMVGLGSLTNVSDQSEAFGISNDGSTVVGYMSSALGNQAFRHTAAAGMVGLGDLPGGGFESFAWGVSGDGSTVVGFGRSALGQEAFRHTAGGMERLEDVPLAADINPATTGWSVLSEARGVSLDGNTIVGTGTRNGNTEAFRHTAGDGMVDLGDLPGGIFESRARGVSGDGSTVVGFSRSASGYEAFRHTAAGMVGLGYLPNGFESFALGVSGDGSTVVGYGSPDPDSEWEYEAFRHTAAGGMERLWDVLVKAGINPAESGWSVLSEARGVSLDGNTIVGFGFRDGNFEAFVAVVPEPTTLCVLAAGAVVVLRRRRK